MAKETVARKRRLTLRSLIDSNEEIWVINRSGEYTGKDAGNVVFQVGSGTMVDSVVIPPGADPVCITDQVDPESLRTCRDLFKLIRSTALELLDPARANEYYDQNKGRKAIVEKKVNDVISRVQRQQTSQHKSGVIHVHTKVQDVCRRLAHGNLTERDAIERLLEQKAVLKEDDYDYLVKNGVHESVKHWASEQARMFKLQEAVAK